MKIAAVAHAFACLVNMPAQAHSSADAIEAARGDHGNDPQYRRIRDPAFSPVNPTF